MCNGKSGTIMRVNISLFQLQAPQNIEQSKRKKLLMCGDWNLNFMLDNIKIQEVKNLLESHNLTNMVRSPTRITPTSESLIDVVIINTQNPELGISVVDMGFSDHLAQVIKINTGKENRNNKIAMRRHLTHWHTTFYNTWRTYKY